MKKRSSFTNPQDLADHPNRPLLLERSNRSRYFRQHFHPDLFAPSLSGQHFLATLVTTNFVLNETVLLKPEIQLPPR